MSGKKFDEGKLRMDLITAEMFTSLAQVLTFGSSKYGDRNWEEGIKEERLIAATLRHIVAYVGGEVTDQESGLNHLKHAMTDLGMLITQHERLNSKLPSKKESREQYLLDLTSRSAYEVTCKYCKQSSILENTDTKTLDDLFRGRHWLPLACEQCDRTDKYTRKDIIKLGEF